MGAVAGGCKGTLKAQSMANRAFVQAVGCSRPVCELQGRPVCSPISPRVVEKVMVKMQLVFGLEGGSPLCVHNAQQKSKGSTVSKGHRNLCDKQAAV